MDLFIMMIINNNVCTFPLQNYFHKAFTCYLHFIQLSSYLQKWSSNNAMGGKQ